MNHQEAPNVVSTTPAGGGDITPAPAVSAPSQVIRITAEDAGVVEPPKPVQTQAEAGSDETFDFDFDDDDSNPLAFPRPRRIVCSASSDGQVTIHRRGAIGLVLTAEEAHTVYAFLEDSMPIWSRDAA